MMSRIAADEEDDAVERPVVETFRYRSIDAGLKLAASRNSSEADRQAFVDAVIADGEEFADYIIARNTAPLRRLMKRRARQGIG